MEVTDVDANGILDMIAVPASADQTLVQLGARASSSRQYFDGSTASGLGSDRAFGLLSADFNRDTDPDVFILRPEDGSTKAFMYSNSKFSGTAPSSGSERFVNVHIAPMPSGLNRQGIGTSVTMILDTPGLGEVRSTQVLDGGSGNGGQSSSVLTFGLGTATGVSMTVDWPNGRSTTYADVTSMTGYPDVSAVYDLNPVISVGSDPHSLTYTMNEDDEVIHDFYWTTTYAGGNPEVLLTIDSPNNALCKSILDGNTTKLLSGVTPGVTLWSIPGNGQFLHHLEWTTDCAAVCSYTFELRNNLSGTIYSGSGTEDIEVKVCPSMGM